MICSPLSLSTEISQVDTTFLLGEGTDYLLCAAPVDATRFSNRATNVGSVVLKAWVVRKGRRRTRTVLAPQLATLSAVGLLFGMRPDRAAKVPAAMKWHRIAQPKAVINNLMVSPDQIAQAVPAAVSAKELAAARVDEVKTIYGRMMLDVAYRIEYAALFDSAVPTTQRFEEALALWDSTPEDTPDEEIIRRSAMVHLTFNTARSHAETVGLAHLPQQAQADARRAAKAARLASEATHDAERDAALDQVIKILSSLTLYYLPTVEQTRHAITRN